MSTLTKVELINALAVMLSVPRSSAIKAVKATLSVLRDALQHERRIELRTFGILKPVTRPGRRGRNPATGEKLDIPSWKTVKFTPSSTLTRHLNNR